MIRLLSCRGRKCSIDSKRFAYLKFYNFKYFSHSFCVCLDYSVGNIRIQSASTQRLPSESKLDYGDMCQPRSLTETIFRQNFKQSGEIYQQSDQIRRSSSELSFLQPLFFVINSNVTRLPCFAFQQTYLEITIFFCRLGECNSAKTMPPDSRSLFTINTSVQEWLQHIKLDHCAPMLLKENRNYLTIGDVLSIDSKTLKSMGISSQDRKVMLKSLDSITVAYHGNFPMENNVASKNNSDILGVTSIAHSII